MLRKFHTKYYVIVCKYVHFQVSRQHIFYNLPAQEYAVYAGTLLFCALLCFILKMGFSYALENKAAVGKWYGGGKTDTAIRHIYKNIAPIFSNIINT